MKWVGLVALASAATLIVFLMAIGAQYLVTYGDNTPMYSGAAVMGAGLMRAFGIVLYILTGVLVLASIFGLMDAAADIVTKDEDPNSRKS